MGSQMDGAVVFVCDRPKITKTGGILTFTLKSGQSWQTFAMPVWLARLTQVEVAALLDEQDATPDAA